MPIGRRSVRPPKPLPPCLLPLVASSWTMLGSAPGKARIDQHSCAGARARPNVSEDRRHRRRATVLPKLTHAGGRRSRRLARRRVVEVARPGHLAAGGSARSCARRGGDRPGHLVRRGVRRAVARVVEVAAGPLGQAGGWGGAAARVVEVARPGHLVRRGVRRAVARVVEVARPGHLVRRGVRRAVAHVVEVARPGHLVRRGGSARSCARRGGGPTGPLGPARPQTALRAPYRHSGRVRSETHSCDGLHFFCRTCRKSWRPAGASKEATALVNGLKAFFKQARRRVIFGSREGEVSLFFPHHRDGGASGASFISWSLSPSPVFQPSGRAR